MSSKLSEWTKKMKAACISRFAAILVVTTTIWATLSYPLAALTLTKKECERLMIPLYACALPRMGVNRHIALVYRYGPKCFHGLGLKHLYTDQGIEQLKILLSHGGSDSYCGILLQCCYELLQLEVGALISFSN